MTRYLFFRREHYFVNDVNDAIAGPYVCLDNVCTIDGDTGVGYFNRYILTVDGCYIAGLDILRFHLAGFYCRRRIVSGSCSSGSRGLYPTFRS